MSTYYLAKKSFDVGACGRYIRNTTWKIEKHTAIRITKSNVTYSGHTHSRSYFDLNNTLLSTNCVEISKSEYELFSKFRHAQTIADDALQDLRCVMSSKNAPWHIQGSVTCAIIEVNKLKEAYDNLAMTTINNKQLTKGTIHYDTY